MKLKRASCVVILVLLLSFSVIASFPIKASSKAELVSDIQSNAYKISTEYNYSNGYVSEWNYTANLSPWNDDINGVAIDSKGNIIAVGGIGTDSSHYQWSVMRFSPDGILAWNYTYDSYEAGDDYANGVAIDSEDNFVVVGYDSNTSLLGDYQWRIMKFNRSNDQLWSRNYNISSGDDRATRVAIDHDNNIIVVGYDGNTSSSIDYQWRIMKFSPDGTRLWQYYENFSNYNDQALGVAIDSDNNITVVGFDSNASSSSDSEWRIMKLSSNGTVLQSNSYNFSPYHDQAWNVAIDNYGNTIVVGYDSSPSQYDRQWRIMKFAPSGASIWNYTVNMATGGTADDPAWDLARSLVVDSFNNITIVGYDMLPYNSSGDFNSEWRVVKLGFDGSNLWDYMINFSPYDDAPRSVAIDSRNDVVAVGFDSIPGSANREWRVMKFRSLSSRVHNTNTGKNYATIQEAIDANETLDGHTILVDAGIYYENVVVNKSVSLIGENTDTTIIDGNSTGTVITATQNNVNITGFTIRRSGTAHPDAGIYLYGLQGCNISNNNIVDNYQGVYLYSSNYSIVSGNNITGNYDTIRLDYGSGNIIRRNDLASSYVGIVLTYSSWNVVSDNVCVGNDIHLEFSPNNTINGNTLVNRGLYVLGSYQNTVWNNTVNGKPLIYLENVYDCKITYGGQVILVRCQNISVKGINLSNTSTGIELYETENCEIANNIMDSNFFNGIAVFGGSSDNVIRNNTISNNYRGICLTNSSDNIVRNNNIINNFYGIEFSSNNTFYHNNFVDNIWSVLSYGEHNKWDNYYPLGGNYWSDYTGIDVYNGVYQNEAGYDWIGDSPYVIDENNTDRYPLMYPFVPETEEMRIAYRNLLLKYNDLINDFKSLNSTYYQLLNDHSELASKFENLNSTYYQHLLDYSELLANYTSLKNNYDDLNSMFVQLTANYTTLRNSYNQLQSRQEAITTDLNNVRNLAYISIGTTIVFIATTIFLALKKTKPQKKVTNSR
jgi:parallel beta-helix repeat protein